jgi:hypothetical protein
VVDIGARALPTGIYAGMFICFMIYPKIRTGNAAAFGNDVLPRNGISRLEVSKQTKQEFSRQTPLIDCAAENFSVAPAYKPPGSPPQVFTRAPISGDYPRPTLLGAFGQGWMSKSWRCQDVLITRRADSGRP